MVLWNSKWFLGPQAAIHESSYASTVWFLLTLSAQGPMIHKDLLRYAACPENVQESAERHP